MTLYFSYLIDSIKSMKKTTHAFTLVELIVVITILAILWTIAFVSLTGYTNDAKNGKVVSDLRNLAGAVEVSQTTGSALLLNLVSNTSTGNTVSSWSVVNNSGATLWSTWAVYLVGNLDFSEVQQNGNNFKDPNSFDENQDYVLAIAFHPDYSFFQFAGQIFDQEIKKSRLTWTYAKKDIVNDVESLISSQSDNTPLINYERMDGDLYQ
jgi:prepilin-type N-terminal cleavage/methylation domain-containing protein